VAQVPSGGAPDSGVQSLDPDAEGEPGPEVAPSGLLGGGGAPGQREPGGGYSAAAAKELLEKSEREGL
jgi:hypothetical protein